MLVISGRAPSTIKSELVIPTLSKYMKLIFLFS
jgi:hypothetical protein